MYSAHNYEPLEDQTGGTLLQQSSSLQNVFSANMFVFLLLTNVCDFLRKTFISHTETLM